MSRPWLLTECTWPEVRAGRYDVAVLPWGATEAHNTHLPYGTDTIETTHVADESARVAWGRGARVLVLPTVPFGVQTGQADIPFCLNLNPSTQQRVVSDLLVSLERHGVRKLVLLNGHGGNDFRALIREVQATTRVFLCAANWYQAGNAAEHFAEAGDHAGELETSVMQHVAPQFVRPLSTAGPGRARRWRVSALRAGWAWAPRHWSQVTDDTGVGNPSAATAEKGASFLAVVVEQVAGFLVELAHVDTDAMYE